MANPSKNCPARIRSARVSRANDPLARGLTTNLWDIDVRPSRSLGHTAHRPCHRPSGRRRRLGPSRQTIGMWNLLAVGNNRAPSDTIQVQDATRAADRG